jgi:hypothetical protein
MAKFVVVRDMLNTFPEAELKPSYLNYWVILASNRASGKVNVVDPYKFAAKLVWKYALHKR